MVDTVKLTELLRKALLLESRMADIEKKSNELIDDLSGCKTAARVIRTEAEELVENFKQ